MAPTLTRDLPEGVVELPEGGACEPPGGRKFNSTNGIVTANGNGNDNGNGIVTDNVIAGTRPLNTKHKGKNPVSADAGPKIKRKWVCGEGLYNGPRRSMGWAGRVGMAARWAKAGVRLKFTGGTYRKVRGWHVPNRIP